ncbi:MAG: PAS domain S-box protein [Syntrophales bacterium]|nr:PAS domain S-box protein [Syntrophales bacterium]MDD5233124.1 PAS domain S-box protein [Syntrophales bacterium]
MSDAEKTREQLLQEVENLRRRLMRYERMRLELWLRGDSSQEIEKLYASLADQADDAVYLMSDGNIEYVNPRFEEIFGISRRELMDPDFDFMSLVAPESRHVIEERLEKSLRGEPLDSTYEFTALTRDGRRIEIEASHSYILYKGKNATQGTFRNVTDRKYSREIIRRAEEKFSLLTETARDLIVSLDLDGRVTYINQAAADFSGYSKEEARGRAITEVIAPSSLAEAESKFEERRHGNQDPFFYEVEAINSRGESVSFEVNSSVILEKGEPSGVLIVARDIRERKKTESELRRSESKLIAIIESAKDSIFIKDADLKYTVVNQAMADLFGMKAGEMVGKTDLDLFGEEIGRKFEEMDRRVLAGQTVDEEIVKPIRGSIRAFHTIKVPLKDTDGGIIGLCGIARDITERRLVEERVRKAEEKYRNIFEYAVEGIYQSTPEGRLITANPAFARMFGYDSPQEIIQSVRDIRTQLYVEPERRDAFIRLLDKYDSVSGLEIQYYRKDGSIIWVSESSRAVRDVAGKIAYFEGVIENVTERKQAEDLYRTLADSSPVGVYVVQKGRFVYANPQFQRYTGYTLSELRGMSPLDLVHKDDRNPVRDKAVRMIKGESSSSYEFRTMAKDGQIRWNIETVRSIRFKGERATLGNFIDVSEQKEAGRRLEELAASESSILASIPHAVFGIENSRITFVNDAAEGVFGWKPKELIGKDIRILYRNDAECSEIWKKIRNDLESRPVWGLDLEFPCLHRNGNELLCRVSASRIGKDQRGERIVAVFEDVTVSKRGEEALRESERRFKNIIDFLPDAALVINGERKVIAWNRAIEQMTKVKAEDMLGRDDYEYALPFYGARRPMLIDLVLEHDEDAEKRYSNLRRNDQIISGESYIPNLHGREVYLLGTATALYDSKGNLVGAIELIRDITETRTSEQSRKQLEAEFLQAQKMEAIGTLAGGIAHDFNNLLMGIQGYTSLMMMDMDQDHPNFKRLKSIEEQVLSGADLTRQLLGFARGGRYEVKPINLNEVVEKTSTMFGRTKKEIKVSRMLGEDLWKVEADQGQIEQVFLNLYVNAWQAMPGGGELVLATENSAINEGFAGPFYFKPGRYVKISVTDTGVGMDEKTRQRIFEPFFTTKEMGRGTGLGLATVYGIVKGHGGVINVFSRKGEGTTFHIYLPAAEEEPAEIAQNISHEILKGNETILLIDDEETVVEVSREILETLGYRVLSASSGAEAVEIYRAKKDKIDLVILDMIIPEMGGERIFEELKNINPGVRVILSSGYSLNGQAVRIMEQGCDDFIQKPFSMRELSKKVRDVLDSRGERGTKARRLLAGFER